MFDDEGFVGKRVWPASWPLLRFIIYFKKGEHALKLPSKDDKYYKWWKVNLYICLRRRISDNPGETTMLAVTLASFFLATGVFFPSDLWVYLFVPISAVYIYILAVGVFYSAYLSLRAAAPADYAETVLKGRNEREAIMATAYEIRSFAATYGSSIAVLRKILDGALLGSDQPNISYLGGQVNSINENLHKHISESHHFGESLSRIDHMQHRLSAELAIPHRKLCDHVLKFSAVLQGIRCQKLIDNWWSILNLIDARADPNVVYPRLFRLISTNKELAQATSDFSDNQEQLLDHESLLPIVRKLAAQHSTSGSIATYARAISNVAAEIEYVRSKIQEARQENREEDLREREEELKELQLDFPDSMLFLHEKQRAHPGMPPHEACIKILSAGDENEIIPTSLVRFLSALGNSTLSDSDDLNNFFEETNVLSHMGSEVEKKISSGRRKVVDNLRIWICQKFGISPDEHDTEEPEAMQVKTCFLVTCGYSKTVREAIVGILEDKRLKDKIRVFVVSVPDGHDNDADARRMVYELNMLSKSDQVGLGQGEALSSLVGADNGGAGATENPVVILLGAEFYTNNCVVHARMDDKPIRQLLDSLKQAEIVFAAESYKCRPEIMTETTFFRFHMDQLAVYTPPYFLASEEKDSLGKPIKYYPNQT